VDGPLTGPCETQLPPGPARANSGSPPNAASDQTSTPRSRPPRKDGADVAKLHENAIQTSLEAPEGQRARAPSARGLPKHRSAPVTPQRAQAAGRQRKLGPHLAGQKPRRPEASGSEGTRSASTSETSLAISALFRAVAGSGRYILLHERPALPLHRGDAVPRQRSFTPAQAVKAGQGQTCAHSPAAAGRLDRRGSSGRERPRGRCRGSTSTRSTSQPDPQDATALLRPKDRTEGTRSLELDPGTGARPSCRLDRRKRHDPRQNTAPDIQPDEILSFARHRYARVPASCSVTGLGQGLQGRSKDLSNVFKQARPDAPGSGARGPGR